MARLLDPAVIVLESRDEQAPLHGCFMDTNRVVVLVGLLQALDDVLEHFWESGV